MKKTIFIGRQRMCAEVAQPGRALDPVTSVTEGEAEDRVVAGSNPALGTKQPQFELILSKSHCNWLNQSAEKLFQMLNKFQCWI